MSEQSTGPVIPPIPGYQYQGRNGESYGPTHILAESVTLSLAIIVVALRVYVKAFLLRALQIEDYLSVLALVLAVVRSSLFMYVENHYQWGQHIWDVESSSRDKIFIYGKAAHVIYLVAVMFAKCSILLFYKRIFGINKKMRIACYTVMGLVVGYCVSFAFVQIFQCTPLSIGWDAFLAPDNPCTSSLYDLDIATGGFNIATDGLIIILPIPLVIKLHLQTARIIGILAVFATGFLVLAMAIVRQVKLLENIGNTGKPDDSWDAARRELWLAVELNIGIVGTCLPILSRLSREITESQFFKKRFSFLVNFIQSFSRPVPEDELQQLETSRDSKSDGLVRLESGDFYALPRQPEKSTAAAARDVQQTTSFNEYDRNVTR